MPLYSNSEQLWLWAQVPADEQSGMERGEVHEVSRQKLGKEEEVFLRGTA